MVTLIWLIAVISQISHGSALECLQSEREARFVESSGDSNSNVIYPNGSSLSEALRALQCDSSLVLSSGQYQLEQYTLVSDLSNVCISGQGYVVISCNENVGLAFVNITGLVMEGVRIEGCGLSGPNLDHALTEIRKFIDLSLVVYSEMRIALLLGHCENLQMNRVELYNNDGFGLVGVNIIGISVISQLIAINNTQRSDCSTYDPENPDRYGGGAVFIYQDYLFEYQELYNNQLYELTIEKGNFTNNTECSFNANVYLDYKKPEVIRNLGYTIGGGGGLTLMMAQLNYGMQIVTRDTTFLRNKATVGSGAHVALFLGTKNTSIKFVNCAFLSNGLSPELLSNMPVVGGAGLGVITDCVRPISEQSAPSNIAPTLTTSIRIQNSQFLRNVAQYGGGLLYYSIGLYKSIILIKDVAYLSIQNSTFQSNLAYFGSAMIMTEFKPHTGFVGTQLQVIDTHITENIITSSKSRGAQSIQQNSGAIDLRNINMTLKGSCNINKNAGTGLKAESSYVGIDGNVTFSENTGVRGGAMHLTTFSYLIVLPNASLYLLNNKAREAGGAIYTTIQANVAGGPSLFIADCFLAFSFDTIGSCVNCSDLNKTGSYIKFEGNSAPAGGQMFGSTLETCDWMFHLGRSLPISKSTITFITEEFPTVFSFDTPTTGTEYFQTQAVTLSAVGLNDTTEFNVLPGQVFTINFTARDGFKQIVSTVISSFVQSELIQAASSTIGSNNFGLLQDNRSIELPMKVTGQQDQNLSVVIYSNDMVGVARTEINVNLGQCGLGYIFDTDSLSCVCLSELETLGVTCDMETLQLMKTRDNLWVGPVDNSSLLGVVQCPLLYCDTSTNNTIPLIQGEPNFDDQCNPLLFRTGVACGDCQKGRSLVLGSERCLECTNVYILLFLVFLLIGFILVYVIYWMDITISTGLLNGTIFFSNVVTLYGTFLFPISGFTTNYYYLIYFLSLNFGFEVCLYNGMRAVDRLLWQLSFPVYLFMLIFLIIGIARIKRFKLAKSFQRFSIVRAITTLLVLCYGSVLQVTTQVFGFVKIKTVDGGSTIRWILQPSIVSFNEEPGVYYVVLLLVAIVLTVVYLLPFPLLLLSPNLIFNSKSLNKFKPVYDSLWSPFEPKYRWWLGFRLIYRWIPFFLAFLAPVPINLFVTDLMLLLLLILQLLLKPFKNYWINTIDSVFVGMLVMMFTGTLFFIANEKQNDRSSDISIVLFNSVIVVLPTVLIVGIIYYHLIIRFPRAKSFTLWVWHKISHKKKFTPPQESIENKDTEMNTAGVTFTEVAAIQLREPCLEDSCVVGAKITSPI